MWRSKISDSSSRLYSMDSHCFDTWTISFNLSFHIITCLMILSVGIFVKLLFPAQVDCSGQYFLHTWWTKYFKNPKSDIINSSSSFLFAFENFLCLSYRRDNKKHLSKILQVLCTKKYQILSDPRLQKKSGCCFRGTKVNCSCRRSTLRTLK